ADGEDEGAGRERERTGCGEGRRRGVHPGRAARPPAHQPQRRTGFRRRRQTGAPRAEGTAARPRGTRGQGRASQLPPRLQLRGSHEVDQEVSQPQTGVEKSLDTGTHTSRNGGAAGPLAGLPLAAMSCFCEQKAGPGGPGPEGTPTRGSAPPTLPESQFRERHATAGTGPEGTPCATSAWRSVRNAS